MNNDFQAVIFDVGGVLVRTFDQGGRRVWEERLGLSPGEAEAIVLNSEMGHRAQRGEITTAGLWAWAGRRLGLDEADLATFRADFWRGDGVDGQLHDLISRLHTQYQMAIISNATDALLESLESYGLLGDFDLVVCSAHEGITKPDPAIYEIALTRLGRAARECVFIDDAPANVAAAEEIGMHAIRFTPALDLEAALAALGVRA